MLSTPNKIFTIVLNYIILAAVVMLICIGLADTFMQSNRVRQQDRLDNYGRYLSAGLVNQLQKFIRQ